MWLCTGLVFIPPGERRLRDECLNINEFWSLTVEGAAAPIDRSVTCRETDEFENRAASVWA
jgi:hypothetical protein